MNSGFNQNNDFGIDGEGMPSMLTHILIITDV